jgi:hypothetical protein
MKVFVALISGVLLSSAAIAQHEHGASTGGGNETASEPATERSTGQSNAPASAEADGADRVICRRVDRSESRLARHRVCMTAAQWREHNRND